MKKNYKEHLSQIKAFVFDVDGVMTDGTVTIYPTGEFIRQMSVKDGYAMQLAIKRGLRIIVITGGRDQSISIRLNRLGITDIALDTHNKLECLHRYSELYDISFDQMLYMGDDVPDIEPMRAIGISACPADACTDVVAISDYVSPMGGGKGAVRDIIEQTLRAQGKWHEEDFKNYNA
ncbi:MAG: HAD hydrolase family protein [Flavobacteriales bacterium]|nr:HAD hydrolase family protein [Flavobacteriales bacterium]